MPNVILPGVLRGSCFPLTLPNMKCTPCQERQSHLQSCEALLTTFWKHATAMDIRNHLDVDQIMWQPSTGSTESLNFRATFISSAKALKYLHRTQKH